MKFVRPFVILDIETGGLDPIQDAILEVAAARWNPDGVGSWDYWHGYYLPNGRVTPEALAVNGLTEEKLVALGATVPFDCEAERFMLWAANGAARILWAGHCVHFDVSFLQALAARKGFPCPKSDHHFVDTAALASPLLLSGDIGSLCLGDLCERFGTVHRPSHGAMDDVFATRALLEKLCEVRP